MSKLDAIKAVVTANPVDLVAAMVDAVGANSNDAKTNAEFQELVQDIVLELSEKWKNFEERDRPTASDVEKGLAKLAEAYHQTNNNRKRKILWNAFWNSFKPEFYDEGIANILWEKVEALEYPDFIFLAKVLDNTDPKEKSSMYFEHDSSIEDGGAHGRGGWRGNQLPVRESEEEAEYADRLSHQNLVEVENSESRAVLLVSWKGLAPKLKKFALDEFEKYEAEKPAAEPKPPNT
jgi:hypothetical protein